MGQLENMRQEDVDFFRKEVEKLQQIANPDLTFKTFPQEDLNFSKRLTVLEEKVDCILARLENIFGDAILINGRFQSLKLPQKGI